VKKQDTASHTPVETRMSVLQQRRYDPLVFLSARYVMETGLILWASFKKNERRELGGEKGPYLRMVQFKLSYAFDCYSRIKSSVHSLVYVRESTAVK